MFCREIGNRKLVKKLFWKLLCKNTSTLNNNKNNIQSTQSTEATEATQSCKFFYQ